MDKLNAIVEIISFEKLIADARKRNEVFFQKLGLMEASPLLRSKATKMPRR